MVASDQPAAPGEPSTWAIDPRLRVLFLAIVAIGLFFLDGLIEVAIACGVLATLWLGVKLPPRRLVRQIVRLWAFVLVVLVAFSLFSSPNGVDHWVDARMLSWTVQINLNGLEQGALLLLRVLAVILASHVARAGDVRALGAGMRKLHIPKTAAIAIDTVLVLFGDSELRRGRGDGSGRRRRGERHLGVFATVRRLARGDVAPLLARVDEQIDRAEAHIAASEHAPTDARTARDIAVIAGIALTILGIKVVKVLPHVPLAPGHKLMLTTPLFAMAGMLTKTRFGATLTGVTMGTVGFLLGDGGKFGVFEIVNNTLPGIITDLVLPILLAGGRTRGPLVWSVFGVVVGLSRFAMTIAVTILMQAPLAAYGFLLPSFITHIVFGAGSGYVTYRIVVAIRTASSPSSTSTPIVTLPHPARPIEDVP